MNRTRTPIQAARLYLAAVQQALVSCGYSADDATLITDPGQLRKAYPSVSGLMAAVTVDIARFSFEPNLYLDLDDSPLDLSHYGWKGKPAGVNIEVITYSTMGFWEDRMMGEIKHIFEVWTTVGDQGRRGQMLGVFTDRKVAANEAQGRGCHVVDAYAVRFDGKWYRLASPEEVELNVNLIEEDERIKREALAKLSPRERRLLGLRET